MHHEIFTIIHSFPYKYSERLAKLDKYNSVEVIIEQFFNLIHHMGHNPSDHYFQSIEEENPTNSDFLNMFH